MWGTTAGDMKIMWPVLVSSFRILWISRSSGRNKFHRHFFLVNAPRFRFRKLQWFLIFLCCGRFPCYSVHQPAKVCIFQPPLRTRRCVGFWISSFPCVRFPWNSEYPQPFWCNRIFRGWGTHRNRWRQVHRLRLWFCHNSFFILLFLRPLPHRFVNS